MKVAFFDVDRTLITSPKGPSMARFEDAIQAVHKIRVKINLAEVDGSTDGLIMRMYLEKNGIRNYKLKECFEAMLASFKRTLPDREYVLLPGVRELLEELRQRGIAIGLVTGNMERIARIKMEKVGIGEFFSIGGFGDAQHDSRHELVGIAIKDVSLKFRVTPKKENVFLFGDTARDIEAARKAGVRCVGTATGIFTVKSLMESGAHLAVENFSTGKGDVLKFMGL